MTRLREGPGGILVSKETILDYSLKEGDLLRLRVLDHQSGRFHIVPFHVLGVVQEFPMASRDSFMVANRGGVRDPARGGGDVALRQSGRRRAPARVRDEAALGASLRDIGAFVRTETLAVLGGAVVLAAGLGWRRSRSGGCRSARP